MTLRLSTPTLELILAPEVGGSIARFDFVGGGARQPLLRPAAEGTRDALGMASFPLVPYANRIRGGAFTCDGVTVRLSPNMAGDPSPLHGQGWLHPWAVEASDATSARLSYVHAPDEWPWRYEAWQAFRLDATGLDLVLGCRNLSDRRMPCGLAHHPYFPCNDDTVIDVPVESAWTADEQVLPVEQVPAAGRYALRDRRIRGAGLDNAFEGWRGTASFTWPERPVRLTMSSPDATRFHIYAPTVGDYIAAEPVQNAVTALNAPQEDWPRLGIELLEPGTWRLLHVRMQAELR